ncbi:MAG TPA: MazG-like family protein [Chloroflexota bacterium]|nr:MazG-like family protein [Chloroflexota bacterium]
MTIPYERLPAFQQKVADFVDAHDLRTGAEFRLLDLVAELGELAKEALKATGYGRRPFIPDERWDDELADVFFSLVCLANSTAVDLDRALDRALAKYGQRLGQRGDAGSGR